MCALHSYIILAAEDALSGYKMLSGMDCKRVSAVQNEATILPNGH